MSENEKGQDGTLPPEANGEARQAGKPVEEAAPVETLEQKVARLDKERADTHDRMLRVAAEFENWKKRSRREVEEAGARGREQLAKEILPVLDNLERALSAVGAAKDKEVAVEQLEKGVKLVDKQLHAVLEKFEIKGFDALGEPFDPAKHEAIQQLETVDHPPGAVAKVFARGYTIGNRLLRPAMVAVAKAPAAEADGDAARTEDAEP